MIRSLLCAALILLVLALPVEAKKPVKSNALAAGTAATVTADATEFHAGDTVTFTATTDATWWKHSILCYQGETLVMVGGWRFYPPGTASVTVVLSSPSYEANPIGAECEVWVAEWDGFNATGPNPLVLIPEPLRFTLLP